MFSAVVDEMFAVVYTDGGCGEPLVVRSLVRKKKPGRLRSRLAAMGRSGAARGGLPPGWGRPDPRKNKLGLYNGPGLGRFLIRARATWQPNWLAGNVSNTTPFLTTSLS